MNDQNLLVFLLSCQRIVEGPFEHEMLVDCIVDSRYEMPSSDSYGPRYNIIGNYIEELTKK